MLLLAACSPSGSVSDLAATDHSSSSSLKEGSTSPLTCLVTRAVSEEPRGGWLPTKGGVLDYNPDSANGTPVPSAQATRMGASFAGASGHYFAVTEAREIRNSQCAVVQWALLHDKAQNSAYLALLHLGQPVNPDSFPLLGVSTERLRLRGGTEVLSSETSDGGVVTVVATLSDGLTVLLQIRRAGDTEGEGYPTTITFQGPGATSSGPAPISKSQAIRAAVTILSETDSMHLASRVPNINAVVGSGG